MNGNRFSLLSLLVLMRKWLKPIAIICTAAFVISAIVAMLLPVKFKSTAIFYPTSSRTANPEWIFAGEEKIEVNVSTMDIDRIMTVAESRELAEYILFKYDLLKDYDLDTTNSPISMQYALEEFNSDYSITHNSRDAIEVSFMHADNKKAAAIANDIVLKIDELNAGLTYENRKKVLELHKQRFERISQEFDRLRDSLTQTRQRYNLLNEERQSQELASRVAKAEASLKEAQGKLEIYRKHLPASDRKIIELNAEINGQRAVLDGLRDASGGNLINLEHYNLAVDKVNELAERVDNIVMYYNRAKSDYDNASIALSSDISTLYFIQKATPSPKKASPIRWLIVTATTLAAFFCSLVLITLYELYRNETQKAMA